MKEMYRILDANFNRAREALRVAEDCGRFALNDPAVTAMAKNMRSDLKEILDEMPAAEFVTVRDTPGDIGTEISSPTEQRRTDLIDVAAAACKRLTEALRSIEECSKAVAPKQVLKIERMRYNAYTLEQRLMGKLQVAGRFDQVRLYALISSGRYCDSVRETARAAIAGGADLIQLREKDIPDAMHLALAAEIRDLTDETGKLFIVNDRPDIAALVGADGVHLGQHDLPVSEARKLLRPGALIGKSTHSLAEALAAATEGADYIGVGPIYETNTKDAGPLQGPELLKEVLAEVSIPVVAIGGITADNVGELVAVGCKCVSVCAAICNAPNPRTAAEAIRRQLT